ncbi:MAG: hypothetical protein AAF465_15930 [Pseudomonadota bacterium]
MSLTLVGFVSAWTASSVFAQMPPIQRASIEWVVTGQFCEPETVLPLPDNTLLVSNVCGFSKTGSGFLSRLHADGTVRNWREVDGLDSPLGMALHEDEVYVVDANRVRVLALPALAQVRLIELDTRVANDIAIGHDGTLFVSDSARHQVVQVSPSGKQSIIGEAGAFTSANGLAVEGRHVYVGGERLWCVHLDTGQITTIGPDWLGDIDGIEFERDGSLQITVVGGPLVRLRNGAYEVIGGEGVSSTNHAYLPTSQLAVIPTGYDNTVVAVRLSE